MSAAKANSDKQKDLKGKNPIGASQESSNNKGSAKTQQPKQGLPQATPIQAGRDSSLKNLQTLKAGKGSDQKSLSKLQDPQISARQQSTASNPKPQTNLNQSQAKNISEIYLHKVPLYQRINFRREQNDPLKNLMEEKKQERKEMMRRVDIEELKLHSQRIQSAIRLRQEAKDRL